jgi:MoxR-like ATPase
MVRENGMTDSNGSPALSADAIDKLQAARDNIRGQLSKVIVGQQEVIDELLISIFSRGHCLLEGVPGLAKTLLISTLAQTLSLSFSRIQFTPDLMPADITGTEVIEEQPGGGLTAPLHGGPVVCQRDLG